jgi:hypothetical protein
VPILATKYGVLVGKSAVVAIVDVLAGKVRVLVPATAGAEIVISPEVSPVSFILAINLLPVLC